MLLGLLIFLLKVIQEFISEDSCSWAGTSFQTQPLSLPDSTFSLQFHHGSASEIGREDSRLFWEADLSVAKFYTKWSHLVSLTPSPPPPATSSPFPDHPPPCLQTDFSLEIFPSLDFCFGPMEWVTQFKNELLPGSDWVIRYHCFPSKLSASKFFFFFLSLQLNFSLSNPPIFSAYLSGFSGLSLWLSFLFLVLASC